MAAGKPAEAVKKFEEAYTEDPKSLETRILYSSLLITAGRTGEAKEILGTLRNEAPDNPDVLYNLSLIKGIEGDKTGQLALLEKVLEIDGNHPQARSTLGEIYLEGGKTDQAEREFSAALEEDPDNIVARIGYGHALLKNEKYEESISQLDKAIKRYPDFPFAYVDRSKANARLNNTNAALKDLSKAIELDPDHYWHYIDRGKLRLYVGNLEGAMDDFNRAIEINPDYFLAYVYRAGAYNEKDQIDEALEDYRKVYEKKPDYYPLYRPSAVISYIKGNYELAREMFLRMYQRFPDEYAAGLMVGICDIFAGNERRGERYLENEMGNWPRDGHSYHLARLFIEPGYDSYVINKIENEKNPPRRTRALFYLATFYEWKNKQSLANTYYMEVSDASIYGLFENRIVEHKLEGVIDDE